MWSIALSLSSCRAGRIIGIVEVVPVASQIGRRGVHERFEQRSWAVRLAGYHSSVLPPNLLLTLVAPDR